MLDLRKLTLFDSEIDTTTGEAVTYYEVIVYNYETDNFEIWHVESDILADEPAISISGKYYINYYWASNGNRDKMRAEALSAKEKKETRTKSLSIR